MVGTVAQSIRKSVPKRHSRVDVMDFKAIVEDLSAKVFQKLCKRKSNTISDATAAILASIMVLIYDEPRLTQESCVFSN